MNINKRTLFLGILYILSVIVLPITYARYSQSFNSTIALNIRQPKYTISFDKNNSFATGTMADEEFDYGTSKALTMNSFSATGYSFNGWNTQADGNGTSYNDQAIISNLSTEDGYNLILYAQWQSLEEYTVSYVGVSNTLGLPTHVGYNTPLVVNFGSTNYAIASVYMGGVKLPTSSFTFANNTLTVSNPTGNIEITVTEIINITKVFDSTSTDGNTYNKTQITTSTISDIASNCNLTAISAVDTVTGINIQIPYNNSGNKDYVIRCDIKVDGNTVANSTFTLTSRSSSTMIFNYTGLNIEGGKVFTIEFSQDSTSTTGGNQKISVTEETITVTFAN